MLVIEGFSFVFGFGFLKEVNKKYKPATSGGMTVQIGLENTLGNLISGDIEELIDILKMANKTEDNKATEKDIVKIIATHDDIDQLFDDVLEELKTSNFTKKKVIGLLERVEKLGHKIK